MRSSSSSSIAMLNVDINYNIHRSKHAKTQPAGEKGSIYKVTLVLRCSSLMLSPKTVTGCPRNS